MVLQCDLLVNFPASIIIMSGEKTNNFWATLNLLVSLDWKKNVQEEVDEWMERVESKRSTWKITEPKTASRITTYPSSKTNSSEEEELVLELPKVECSFSHPKIRSRLERLMGSNLVRLTDRKYMLQLHDRILEDYIQSMNQRIAEREAKEREREKDLVLSGRIPLSQAPKEMANHPVLLINAYCEKLIAERRAKIKVPKVHIPKYLYEDDTPDPPYGLSIADGHVLRNEDERTCTPPEVHLATSDDEDIENGYMFLPEDYEKKQKYESPQIRELSEVETVEKMYILADEIIGPLKTIKDPPPPPVEKKV